MWLIKLKTVFVIINNNKGLCSTECLPTGVDWADSFLVVLGVLAVFINIITKFLADVELTIPEPLVLVGVTEVTHQVIHVVVAVLARRIDWHHFLEDWGDLSSFAARSILEPGAVWKAVFFFRSSVVSFIRKMKSVTLKLLERWN